jgi:hypothetical protein
MDGWMDEWMVVWMDGSTNAIHGLDHRIGWLDWNNIDSLSLSSLPASVCTARAVF